MASPLLAANPEFMAIEMPGPRNTTGGNVGGRGAATQSADPLIHVGLRRGLVHLSFTLAGVCGRRPASAGEDFTAWLRELTSGLLK